MATTRVAWMAAIAPALASAAPALAAPPCAGQYRASEPEIAAELELTPEGRFRYTLAYGAIDEEAKGRWRAERDRVVLTSDPVTPPAFALIADEPLPERRLRVALELPGGVSRQYFTLAAKLADGAVLGRQFAEEGIDVAVDAANPPVAVRIDLPLFALSSPDFALSGGAGHAVRIRFSPNDLDKVAFADTPLPERDGAFLLQRHERSLAFRRVGRCQG